MAPLLLMQLALGLACGGGLVACADAPQAPDGLACAEPEVDFGPVWEGAVLEHEFVFTAGGTAARTIENVRSDCGCTVGALLLEPPGGGAQEEYVDGTPIAPGSRLLVRARYDTRGKRGSVPRTLTLYTSDGATSVVLRAEVRPWLVVEPEGRDLPRLDDRSEARTTFRVTSAEGEPFGLAPSGLGIPDLVRVEPVPVAPGADGRSASWDVAVTLPAGMPRGSHVYPIELRSDVGLEHADPASGRATHAISPWITVQVVGPVSLSPPNLSFGVVDHEATVARTVRLLCHDQDFVLGEPELELLPVRSGEEFALARTATLSARPVEGENAWDVQLLLSGLDPGVQGTFLARVSVGTGHPGEPRLEAPVTGVVLPAGAAGAAGGGAR
jgi:hypothetical protein